MQFIHVTGSLTVLKPVAFTFFITSFVTTGFPQPFSYSSTAPFTIHGQTLSKVLPRFHPSPMSLTSSADEIFLMVSAALTDTAGTAVKISVFERLQKDKHESPITSDTAPDKTEMVFLFIYTIPPD